MADIFETKPNNFGTPKSITKYLDHAGLISFWGRVKDYVDNQDLSLFNLIKDQNGEIADLKERMDEYDAIGGGSNIYPDWNNNTPGKPGYIENRTHYINYETINSYSEQGIPGYIEKPYTVCFNGKYYTLVEGENRLSWGPPMLVHVVYEGDYGSIRVDESSHLSDDYPLQLITAIQKLPSIYLPSSMPADGGNADTVDNKHASDFVLKAGDTMVGNLTMRQNDGGLILDQANGNGKTSIYMKPNGSTASSIVKMQDASTLRLGSSSFNTLITGTKTTIDNPTSISNTLAVTGDVTAPKFIGDLQGKADTAGSTVGTLTVSQPKKTDKFDGSTNVTITVNRDTLGLDKVMDYIGKTSTPLSDGSTTNPITIDSKSITAVNGNVVIDKDSGREYIWNGSAWELFGADDVASSYKPKQSIVNDPTASGTSTTFIDTISQDINGKITATKKNIPTIPTNTSQLTNNNQTFIGRTDSIMSNTDANNFTNSGAYLFQTGNGGNNTNFPITGYGILNVFNSPYSNQTTNYIGQLLLGSYNIFYRTKIDTWSDWKQIALTSDIPDLSIYMKGHSQSSTDFNELLDIGIYRASGSNVNRPTGSNGYGNLMVVRGKNSDTLTQVYFDYGANNNVYIRSGNATGIINRDWKTLAFTSDIPTKLSQLTDDVVAGKYLPLSGGTMVGELAIKAGATNSATIRFRPNNGAINHWLGVNSAGVLWFSNNGWSQQYDILHSGNIGNYKSGDSDKLGGYDISRFLLTTKRDYSSMDLNTIGDKQSIFTEIRTGEVTTSNCPISGYGALLSLKDGNSYAKMQIVSASGSADTYIRCTQGSGSTISANWQRIITDNNIGNYNAGSATKLKTPRKLWGNDFDGTADVDGAITIKNGANLTLQSPSDAQTDPGDIVFTGFGGDELCRLYKDPHDSQMLMRFGETGTSYTMLHSGNIGNYNAGSATKLQTPRKLWGQSFDGTGDIWGSILLGQHDLNVSDDTSTYRAMRLYPDYGFYIGSGTSSKYDTLLWGKNIQFVSANGLTRMCVQSDGNVGIGTTSPTERLDVSGNVKANGFIKTDSSDSYVLLGGGGHKSLSDFSKASWKSFTPAETALTNDDVLSTTGEFSLAKGSWYYAGNGYLPAGEFGNIDLAGCSVLTFGGKSGGAYTQLFITSPAPMGSNAVKANEILFYNNHGEGYNPGWTRVLTNRNYTEYIPTSLPWSSITSKPTFATVATTGSYNDLTNKPTIANYYHTRSYSSGLQISTGTGVSNMYVPYATVSQAGVVSTGDQTFAGIKTFNNELKMQGGGTYSTDIATGIACGFKVNRATINDAIIENIYLGAKYGATKSNMTLNIKKYGSISSTAPASTTTLVSINESGHVTANAFYINSDERLKTFGDDIKVDFDELAKLRKSHFVFNNNPTKQEIGVSAQEVQKIYPEIVNETEEGTLSVDYSKLAVVALAAIDKLNQRVQELENKLAKYE